MQRARPQGMSSEAAAAEAACIEPMNRLDEAVAAVRAVETVPERKQPNKEAEKAFQQAKRAIGQLRNEVKRIEDPTQKSVFQRKYGDLDARLKAYGAEMKDLMRVKRAPQATAEEKQMEAIMGEGNLTGAKFQTKGEVMDAAVRATDANTRILQSVEMNVATIEATGNEIATKLATDTEKIREIDKNMSTLQAEIDRAKNDLMWFARQMAGDKCFLIVMVLVIAALVLLTFYSIFDKRTTKATPAPTAPAEAASPGVNVRPPPGPAGGRRYW